LFVGPFSGATDEQILASASSAPSARGVTSFVFNGSAQAPQRTVGSAPSVRPPSAPSASVRRPSTSKSLFLFELASTPNRG
jgi:hypothetical protein